MASGNRPDLDRLSAAVDALGDAFTNLAIETFTSESLKLASLEVSRAANMIDGIRADLARKERDLRPPPGVVAPPPSRSLDPDGQRPAKQSERDSERSNLFDELPALGDATRRGELSGAYADTVNHAVAKLTETERAEFYAHHRDALTKHALTMGLHEFQVHVRRLVDDVARARQLERFQQQRRDRSGGIWTDPGTGMVKLFAKFDPETGARVRQAINEEIDRLYRGKRDDPNDTTTHQQLVADAIANLILGARASGRHGTELVVLVDLHTLITDDPRRSDTANDTATPAAADSNDTRTAHTADATHADPGDGTTATGAVGPDEDTPTSAGAGRCCETSDGTPLPVETVRRLACEAGIIPAVLNGHGVIVDLGRSQRLASPAQRRQLRAMYPTCAFNDCTTSFDRCEIHHVDPFGAPTNGETNIDKLVPACQLHHHRIHDAHLQLSLDAGTRTLTVTHPDGHVEIHPFLDRRRRPGADRGNLSHTA